MIFINHEHSFIDDGEISQAEKIHFEQAGVFDIYPQATAPSYLPSR